MYSSRGSFFFAGKKLNGEEKSFGLTEIINEHSYKLSVINCIIILKDKVDSYAKEMFGNFYQT